MSITETFEIARMRELSDNLEATLRSTVCNSLQLVTMTQKFNNEAPENAVVATIGSTKTAEFTDLKKLPADIDGVRVVYATSDGLYEPKAAA